MNRPLHRAISAGVTRRESRVVHPRHSVEAVMRHIPAAPLFALLAMAAVVGFAGCSGSGPESGNTLTVSGDVAIAYAKRSTTLNVNPTNGAPFAAGGDLIIREKS